MANRKRLLWGYIDKDGNCVIAPRFDGASDFHDGLAMVQIDWRRGYVDRAGELVIEPQYQSASDFHDGVALVGLDGQKSYIDKSGKSVTPPPGFDEVTPSNPSRELNPVVIDGKYGYANEAGEVVIAPKFWDAGQFCERLARVKQTASGKWGFINIKGAYAFRAKFKQAGDFHEGLAKVLVETIDED